MFIHLTLSKHIVLIKYISLLYVSSPEGVLRIHNKMYIYLLFYISVVSNGITNLSQIIAIFYQFSFNICSIGCHFFRCSLVILPLVMLTSNQSKFILSPVFNSLA